MCTVPRRVALIRQQGPIDFDRLYKGSITLKFNSSTLHLDCETCPREIRELWQEVTNFYAARASKVLAAAE
jgi:hypothetical protein